MQLLVLYPMKGTRSDPLLCAAYSDLIPQPKLSDVLAPEGVGEGHGYPYSASAHSWPPPLSTLRAVCSAMISLNCRAAESCLPTCTSAALNPLPPCCLPHCHLVPHEVSTQQQCAEVSEPRESAPSAHPDVCAESKSLSIDAHDRHSIGRDAVPADHCTRLASIPL